MPLPDSGKGKKGRESPLSPPQSAEKADSQGGCRCRGAVARGLLQRVQAHDQPAQDSTLETTRTKRGWKARETSADALDGNCLVLGPPC